MAEADKRLDGTPARAVRPENQAGEPNPGGLASGGSLDVDVSSSGGPYSAGSRRATRKSSLRIWLAAVVAAVVLGLTWAVFRAEPPAEDRPTIPVQPALSAAVPPPAASADQPAANETIDFAPTLDQPRPEKPAPAPPKATPAAVPVPTKPEETPKATPAAAPVPTKPEETPKATPAAVPVPTKPEETPKVTSAGTTSNPTPPEEAPKETPAAASDQEISDKWVVNISSTPDASESLKLLSSLLGQEVGGQVYASEVILEGRLQHRIRVGFFDTREEAEAVGLELKERYRLSATPWAVRPIKGEESKYSGGGR